MGTSQWRNLVDTTLSNQIYITKNRTCPSSNSAPRTQHSCNVPAQTAMPESNHCKTSDKPELTDSL